MSTSDTDILKLAVLAVGGQGGGVLTNWIAELADLGGYDVQMTSVAGVAQRTGATIYYVEMAPKSARKPVFALSPSPGDLDILIAAELMEAGRAVLRGFVTPDRTTLIASTHRILAVSEKEVPGDGRADDGIVAHEITQAALKSECFDMETIAQNAGSMISASLFGALARSTALPFAPELFEQVITKSGRGVDQSLTAFRGALNYAPTTAVPASVAPLKVSGPEKLVEAWNKLVKRAQTLPKPAQNMVLAGLQKTVDFQDVAYGDAYLDHVQTFADTDQTPDQELTTTAAKYIANAMCYDDLPRVADLKIRASRDARLRREQEVGAGDIVHVTEYFHPRGAEVCASLPARLGAAIEARPKLFKLLDRAVNRGRRVRTDSIRGFVLLWCVSKLRPFRRKLLRHQLETEHLERVMGRAHALAATQPALAIQVLKCQRLIKGYSDTHHRSQSKFTKVFDMIDTLETRPDAAEWLARLRKAALKDEQGEALDGAIATIRSFAP